MSGLMIDATWHGWKQPPAANTDPAGLPSLGLWLDPTYTALVTVVTGDTGDKRIVSIQDSKTGELWAPDSLNYTPTYSSPTGTPQIEGHYLTTPSQDGRNLYIASVYARENYFGAASLSMRTYVPAGATTALVSTKGAASPIIVSVTAGKLRIAAVATVDYTVSTSAYHCLTIAAPSAGAIDTQVTANVYIDGALVGTQDVVGGIPIGGGGGSYRFHFGGVVSGSSNFFYFAKLLWHQYQMTLADAIALHDWMNANNGPK